MTALPTGRLEHRDGGTALTFTRELLAPLDRVWRAVTAPDLLTSWFGKHEILTEEPPTLLALDAVDDAGRHRFIVELAAEDSVTRLTLVALDPADVAGTGPRWDHRLDHLVAVEKDPEVPVFDYDRDYADALRPHYEALASRL